jgi:hypothetical protein
MLKSDTSLPAQVCGVVMHLSHMLNQLHHNCAVPVAQLSRPPACFRAGQMLTSTTGRAESEIALQQLINFCRRHGNRWMQVSVAYLALSNALCSNPPDVQSLAISLADRHSFLLFGFEDLRRLKLVQLAPAIGATDDMLVTPLERLITDPRFNRFRFPSV